MKSKTKNVIWFEELSRGDVGIVGGKNASLGEMVKELSQVGIKVPPGFATTADAFRNYVKHNKLDDVLEKVLGDFEAKKIPLLKQVPR